jgi:hypothetical protein
MRIADLIYQEEQVLIESQRSNEDILINTESLIMILSNAVVSEDIRAVSFFFLSNQVRNDLILSLLSSLRNHETQSKIMKRQAIEKACLAAFSLYEPDIDKFLEQDEKGSKPVKKALDRAFKYIEKEFPSHSYRLKQVKDMINGFYAHGNMFNSLRKEGEFDFFDKHDAFLQRSLLWEIGYVACVIFDLWYQSAKQSVFAAQDERAYIEYVEMVSVSQKYREWFVNHERFAKWK